MKNIYLCYVLFFQPIKLNYDWFICKDDIFLWGGGVRLNLDVASVQRV